MPSQDSTVFQQSLSNASSPQLIPVSASPSRALDLITLTVYLAALGGFKVSFITDVIQGAMVCGLIIIAIICVGVETTIEKRLIDESGYLEPSLLGWQLIYILPVAIFTNDFFISVSYAPS